MEGLISYVWRRQLAASAGRALANPDEMVARSMAVGFADMVGFTSLTRQVDEDDLAVLVDRFEAVASDVVAERGGRVIKTVGDEVMFAADEPASGGGHRPVAGRAVGGCRRPSRPAGRAGLRRRSSPGWETSTGSRSTSPRA